MMRHVLLLLLGAHLAYAGTHSYQYFYTATSGLPDFPEFVAVGMVNGEQINYYDSSTMEAVIKADWVKGIVNPTEWKNIWLGSQQWYKQNLPIMKKRFNQSDVGVHTLQIIYGCELDSDGTTQGYYQFGYDGKDFISFDKDTRTWTAAVSQAVMSKNKLDPNTAHSNQWKAYLENICIDWLNKYVGYGKDTLERKVSPRVSLLQKDPSSPVTCHATGFYPSGVKISWQKNEQDRDEDVDLGEIIPNEDGTFQRMSTLNVEPEEWKKNKYECVVEHQSKTIKTILTEKEIKTNYASVPIGIIVGAVAAVLLLIVIGVVGYVVYQKKKGFKPVPQTLTPSDDGSNSSARTDPHA